MLSSAVHDYHRKVRFAKCYLQRPEEFIEEKTEEIREWHSLEHLIEMEYNSQKYSTFEDKAIFEKGHGILAIFAVDRLSEEDSGEHIVLRAKCKEYCNKLHNVEIHRHLNFGICDFSFREMELTSVLRAIFKNTAAGDKFTNFVFENLGIEKRIPISRPLLNMIFNESTININRIPEGIINNICSFLDIETEIALGLSCTSCYAAIFKNKTNRKELLIKNLIYSSRFKDYDSCNKPLHFIFDQIDRIPVRFTPVLSIEIFLRARLTLWREGGYIIRSCEFQMFQKFEFDFCIKIKYIRDEVWEENQSCMHYFNDYEITTAFIEMTNYYGCQSSWFVAVAESEHQMKKALERAHNTQFRRWTDCKDEVSFCRALTMHRTSEGFCLFCGTNGSPCCSGDKYCSFEDEFEAELADRTDYHGSMEDIYKPTVELQWKPALVAGIQNEKIMNIYREDVEKSSGGKFFSQIQHNDYESSFYYRRGKSFYSGSMFVLSSEELKNKIRFSVDRR